MSDQGCAPTTEPHRRAEEFGRKFAAGEIKVTAKVTIGEFRTCVDDVCVDGIPLPYAIGVTTDSSLKDVVDMVAIAIEESDLKGDDE